MLSSLMIRSFAKSPTQFGIRHASSVMMKYEESIQKLPMREAVRYTEGNTKWTAADLKMHVDAHANALLEHKFKKGDKIALWMDPNQHKQVCLLAYAKMGITVYDIDTKISNVSDVRAALVASQCKMIIFPPKTESQDNLRLLRYAVPELFYYQNDMGQHFHSKHFPHLKFFAHTGYDLEAGTLTFKSLFMMNPLVSAVEAQFKETNDDLPYYCRIALGQGGSGIEVGELMAQKDCLKMEQLSFLKNLIEKVYYEV